METFPRLADLIFSWLNRLNTNRELKTWWKKQTKLRTKTMNEFSFSTWVCLRVEKFLLCKKYFDSCYYYADVSPRTFLERQSFSNFTCKMRRHFTNAPRLFRCAAKENFSRCFCSSSFFSEYKCVSDLRRTRCVENEKRREKRRTKREENISKLFPLTIVFKRTKQKLRKMMSSMRGMRKLWVEKLVSFVLAQVV